VKKGRRKKRPWNVKPVLEDGTVAPGTPSAPARKFLPCRELNDRELMNVLLKTDRLRWSARQKEAWTVAMQRGLIAR